MGGSGSLGAFAATTFKGSTAAGSGRLGEVVAAGGELTGDGFGDLLIGAPEHDTSSLTAAGAVMLVEGDNKLVTTSVVAVYVGYLSNEYVGAAVVGELDFDGDGDGDFAVGAPGDAGGGAIDAGAVYLLTGPVNTSGCSPASPCDVDGEATSSAKGSASDQRLGSALSAVDVDGDGYDDLLVGAPGGEGPSGSGLAENGVTYLFQGNTSASLSTYALLYGEDDGEGAGAWVQGAGDYNGDGYGDLLVSTDDDLGSLFDNETYLILGGL